jgi:hypothetical protein
MGPITAGAVMDGILFWVGCVVAFMIVFFFPPREVKEAMLRESEARERRNQRLL